MHRCREMLLRLPKEVNKLLSSACLVVSLVYSDLRERDLENTDYKKEIKTLFVKSPLDWKSLSHLLQLWGCHLQSGKA